MTKTMGLIEVKTNDDLDAEALKDKEAKEAMERQMQQPILGLVAWVHRCWEAAKRAKQPITKRMLTAMRMTAGEHEPEKLAEIKEFGGSEIYMMIPDEKCTSLEAWLLDTLFVPGEKPFTTEQTPEPEIPPSFVAQIKERLQAEIAQARQNNWVVTREDILSKLSELHDEIKEDIMEEARKNEAKAESLIHDSLVEADWEMAMKEGIPELCRFPAAFIKGPIFRNKQDLAWDKAGQPIVEKQLKRAFNWVSGFDIYPSPNSRTIEDGWLFEHQRLTRGALHDLIGVDGYDDDAIRMVLSEYGQGSLTDWLGLSDQTERRRLENRESDFWDPDTRIDALQWWGQVQGLYLLQNGMDPDKVPDPLAEYNIELILVGNYVIKCVINGDPLGRKPYFKSSFRNVPGSFWGKSPCDIMVDKVDACNAAARQLINNMAIASGPQVGVDVGMSSPEADNTKMWPWKVWSFDMRDATTARPPIWFFQPDSNITELIAVYDKFSQEIDTQLGIPKYATGSNDKSTGALSTATGTSILQTNLLKGIKRVTGNIDDGWIVPSVTRQHQSLLLYDRAKELLGCDLRLVATGASSMVAREQQQLRRNEFLNLVMNPAIMEFVGPLPMIETLRSVAQGVDIDLRNTLPSKEDMIKKLSGVQTEGQALIAYEGGNQVDGAGNQMGGADFATA